MPSSPTGLQKAEAWAAQGTTAPACHDPKCLKGRYVMVMYRCYGPGCKAHSHENLKGFMGPWEWSTGSSDRYFCSRTCYLNRFIEHLGVEGAETHINNFWFRHWKRVAQEIEGVARDLDEALDELEHVVENYV